jgi:uncharacterized protein (DUF952 family)
MATPSLVKPPIYHIAAMREVEDAGRNGVYAPATLQSEGFIHCSHAGQLAAVADRYFRGQPNLALLQIDPQHVTARIVEENLVGGAQLYPHIYGTLPMSAVTAIRELPCNQDGSFAWPCNLSGGS